MTKIKPFRLFVFYYQNIFYVESAKDIKIQIWVTLIAKSAAYGCPEACQKQILEFLRACYNNKDYAHVLHQLLFLPKQP